MSVCKIQAFDELSINTREFSTQMTGPTNVYKATKRLNTCFHHLRYVVVVLGGLMCGSMLFCRFTINVALLSMVNKTAIYLTEHPNSTVEEYFPPDYVEIGIFEWNHEIQQIIMTGYMVAYALPQYATTRLSLKYGLKTTLPISVLICSISCLFTPYFSYWGWKWVLALRLINGVGASALMPTMFSIVELWMPPEDRAFGFSIVQIINSLTVCITPWISGLLTSIHWKWAFYFPTVFGFVISSIWYSVTADSPNSSKFISQLECDLINETDKIDKSSSQKEPQKDDHRSNIPWYFVFKIKSFYFLTVAFVLLDSTSCSFLFILPSYINRVLKLSVDDTGMIFSTIQIGAVFCLMCPNPVGKFLQKQFELSLTGARNVMTFICCFMVVSTFIYLAFFHNYLILTLLVNRFFHVALDFIVLTTIMTQFSNQGLSGLVFSVINAIGNFSILLVCWIVGRVLDYTGDSLECWFWILNTFGAMMLLYFFIFVIFLESKPVIVNLPSSKGSEEDPKKQNI